MRKRKKRFLSILLTAVMMLGTVPAGVAAPAQGHAHTDTCYAQEGDLRCTLPESEGHTHDDSCYCPGGEYICSEEESDEHTHTDDCTCPGGELTCGKEESEGHTHSENCYAKGGELICSEEEQPSAPAEDEQDGDETPVPEDSDLENTVDAADFAAVKAAVEKLAASATEKSGTIRITADIAFSEQLAISSGVSVTITDDETSHKISKTPDASGSTKLFVVADGAELTIDGNLTLLAEKEGDGLIECHGKLMLKQGVLDFGGESIPAGRGIVSVWGEHADFTMEDGRIQNAYINACSAGVRICGGGSFTMNGGTISGMTAGGNLEAGAVLVFSSDSTSLGKGTASFTMNDGVIENNTGYRGAGVFVIGREYTYRASMIMNGGTIRNNTCTGDDDDQGAGAGVYVQQNAEFTMNDGEISGNVVDMGEGGGVCVACGWESVAGTPGWNIDLFSRYYPAAFTMNGGTIQNNQARMNTEHGDNGCGGGIYVASNCVTLNGGVIENNTAEKQGGGVYVGATPYVLKIHNAVVKENHATILGGGLWACPTGDVELFVTNGAALYDNSSDEAGDDLVSVKIPSKKHSLTLADRALGGGQVLWYKDGGVDNSSILGFSDGSPRYAVDDSTPLNPIREYGDSIALKAIMSDGAKSAAMSASSLIIRGNEAPRGGGIGTNGGVVLGDETEYDYTLQVKKIWIDAEDEQKVPVTVYLKLGDHVLDSVELNAENGWAAEFTGLPDPKTLGRLSYAVVENPVPANFTPSYTPAEIDEDTRIISITLDNRYTPSAPTGSLTISKKVAGTGTPSTDTLFEFTVTKDGTAAVGQYSVDGGEAQAIPENGKISFKAGQSAVLIGLEPGEYTVTETSPAQANYKSTVFAVNGSTVQDGCTASVAVTAVAAAATGGWKKENGVPIEDEDGYFMYTITSDQIDADGNITVDCDLLAEYMEAQMRNSQNWSSCNFKVKFVNETGVPIHYQDYSFDTVNWIPVGQTYTASGNPAMLNTGEGADSTSAGYGWGEVWQPMYSFLTGQSSTAGSLNADGFDGNKVRITIAPLRCINPAVISYFSSNPGKETLTGNSSTNSAQTITLKQMNALPTLIKQEFSFQNCEGEKISLPADSSRTYADFICAFYGVNSLNELTVAQKYNVLGTGFKGSLAVPYDGQSHITTYYSNLAGTMSNWCIPYTTLDGGTLDYFKTWGFSDSRIEAGKKLISGGQEFSADDAAVYAYQPNYFLLEDDPEVLKMAYEYLYSRCIRFSLDTENRSVSTAIDNSATSNDSVGGIKDYMDRTDAATANVLTAMNNGAAIADGDSLTLDRVKGYIEVPNAWNQFRYYDFGFQLTFKSDAEQPSAAAVVFTNQYEEDDMPPTPPTPGKETGSLTVSKNVAGNAGSQTTDFHFTVKLSDTSVSGTYGDMTFTNGVAEFTLKHGEQKTASAIPVGVQYTVTETEANQNGYSTTASGDSGTIEKNTAKSVSFTNTKNSSGGGGGSKHSYGKLTVSKTVEGNAGETDRKFIFTVKLDRSLTGKYGDMTFDKGIAVITLKHGENSTATDLPSGVAYTVTESDNDGYTVTAAGDTGTIRGNQTVTAAFTNTKNVTPPDNPDKPTPPEQPETPNKPVTPETPANPDKPNTPEQPTSPDKTSTTPSPSALNQTPRTDDTAHLALWFVLIAISAVGLVISLVVAKKYHYRGKRVKH